MIRWNGCTIMILGSVMKLVLFFTVLILCSLMNDADAGVMATGSYWIHSEAAPRALLSVQGAANASGTPVVNGTHRSDPAAQWMLEAEPDGSYKIYAFNGMNSLQMLDHGGQAANEDAVCTNEDLAVDGQDDTNQKWWLTEQSNGAYEIVSASTGSKCLTQGASSAPATLSAFASKRSQLFLLTPISHATLLVNPKKGIPTGTPALDAAAGLLHCSWVYNWGMKRPAGLPSQIEYVPMVWGWWGDTSIGQKVLADAPGSKEVLGFNEPDFPNKYGGSNIPVDQALTAFKYVSDLKSQGLTIGGPACGVDSDDWMKTFMSQAQSSPYNYHIDFIGFHTYQKDPTPEGAAAGVLGFCDYVYSIYHKPIWATEFAPTHLSNTDAMTFVRLVCQGFQKRAYVQRYSMFTSEHPSDTGMGTSALVNPDGTLTNVGRIYARM
jgi:hypothetical protein